MQRERQMCSETKLVSRMPIGKKEYVESFTAEDLRRSESVVVGLCLTLLGFTPSTTTQAT